MFINLFALVFAACLGYLAYTFGSMAMSLGNSPFLWAVAVISGLGVLVTLEVLFKKKK